MPQQTVDGVGRAVLLELVQRFPDLRIVEMDIMQQTLALPACREPVFEHVEEGFVIDELRRIRSAQASEGRQDFILSIAGKGFIAP